MRDPTLSLSPKFTEALLYAAEIHGRQRRKGSGIPFMAHLLGVASIVLEDGGDEEEGIAALLHDAIEDHPRNGLTSKEILEHFGDRVHRIVLGCTDTDPHGSRKSSWETRKKKFIDHLRHEADPDVLRVATADKLYNARSILNDMRFVGQEVWSRFSVPKEKTLWYYREVTNALKEQRPRSPQRLVRELEGIVWAMTHGVKVMDREVGTEV
ncbi:MAG: HD domain-containing protein [Gemmatimonadales bacterium]